MDAVFSPARFRHVVFAAPSRGRLRVPRAVVTSPELPDDLSPLRYDEETFLCSLFLQAGIDIRAYRIETLKRRIPASLRALRSTSLDEARRLARVKPTLLKAAMNALLIGVSAFFRDAVVFDALAQWLRQWTATPLDLTLRRGPRVWSVACSDGQELYSVAMLLAERAVLEASDLLGTDCRLDAVQAARAGVYRLDSVGPLLDQQWGTYFEPAAENLWRVTAPVRRAIRWRVGDALRLVEPGTWDLILCRNMVMYLKPEAARRVWKSLAQALRPGGILVTGKAERPDAGSGFSSVGPCLFRRDRF